MLLDHRVSERYVANPETYCNLLVGVGKVVRPASVRDISATGMGLEMPLPFETGIVLHIEVINRVKNYSRKILANVVHCNPGIGSHWLVGFQFVRPISNEELDELL